MINKNKKLDEWFEKAVDCVSDIIDSFDLDEAKEEVMNKKTTPKIKQTSDAFYVFVPGYKSECFSSSVNSNEIIVEINSGFSAVMKESAPIDEYSNFKITIPTGYQYDHSKQSKCKNGVLKFPIKKINESKNISIA